MTKNSLICQLISSHDKDWCDIVRDKGINFKSCGGYTIFNYNAIGCDFSDPVVQEARGIIIDIPKLEVVCWPFRKFGNYVESYADDIDWESARVQAKIDGSIVKLWWSDRSKEWIWSTNSCIYAKEAPVFADLTFSDVIREALCYTPVDTNVLDKNHTYMFELVSPYTQVVVRYPRAELWHIGTRDNISGNEFVEDIGVQKPKEYLLHSLEDCIKAASELNRKGEAVRQEGFVVVDKNWHRIKVKSPEYFVAHKLETAKPEVIKKLILTCLLNNNEDELHFYREPFVSYYRYWLEELKSQIQTCIDASRRIYGEMNCDRKSAASLISREKFPEFGFMAIDHVVGYSADDAVRSMTFNKLRRYIPTYKQPLL